MKKLISILSLIGLSVAANAATYNFTIPTATMTNFNSISGVAEPIRVLSVSLTAPANAAGSCLLIDCPTNALTLSVGAYTNQLLSATNNISSWVNYYGTTNWSTNLALVHISNYVAAATFTYPVRSALTAPTNSTVNLDQVNSFFFNGLGITNTSLGTINVSVVYQQ